jgi:hypothetical protein
MNEDMLVEFAKFAPDPPAEWIESMKSAWPSKLPGNAATGYAEKIKLLIVRWRWEYAEAMVREMKLRLGAK